MKFRQKFSYDLVFLAVDDFNAILFHWENLRVLHFSSEWEFVRLHLSYGLSSHKSLEKIVIPSGPGLFTKYGTLWGVVTKYWLDPRHIFAPDAVKNAIKLKIYIERLSEEFAMQQNCCDLSNLETLEIYQYPTSEKNSFLTAMLRRRGMSYYDPIPNNELLSRFKNLKALVIEVEIHIDFLLDLVRLLGITKTLKISVTVEVKSDYDEQYTKEIFTEALKVMKEKFPFPAIRIMDLKIFEEEGYEGRTTFSIYCDNSEVILITSDNSDSSDESVNTHNYDSMDESVENSDSFDESDENSVSMDESDEDSENKDHMDDPDPDY